LPFSAIDYKTTYFRQCSLINSVLNKCTDSQKFYRSKLSTLLYSRQSTTAKVTPHITRIS